MKTEHQNAEAFKLMTYACQTGHRTTIWNSRDGVTPFAVACPHPKCHDTARHIEWKQDRYSPNHALELQEGALFFRDGTPEEARAIVRRRLELSKGTDYEQPEAEWPALIDQITKSEEFRPGWPQLDRFTHPPAAPTPAPDQMIWATSIYGVKNREPLVEIHWRDTSCQLSPEQARLFALSVLGAAEAAEQDAFLMDWAIKTMGCDLPMAAQLLHQFRRWREDHQKGTPDGK